MIKISLKRLESRVRRWFRQYTVKFKQTSRIKQKIEHTNRVINICSKIAELKGWNEREIHLIKIIATLHDIGRFEQEAEHNTFDDSQSLDHAYLGIQVIDSKKLLFQDLTSNEIWLIKECIFYHNKIKVPSFLRSTKFFQLLFEVDRFDILNSNIGHCHELDTICFIKDEFLEDFIHGYEMNYFNIQTELELALFQLNWVCLFQYQYLREHSKRLVKAKLKILEEADQYNEIYKYTFKYFPSLQNELD